MEAQEERRAFIEGHRIQHTGIRHREETTLGEVEMGGVEAKDERWTRWRQGEIREKWRESPCLRQVILERRLGRGIMNPLML